MNILKVLVAILLAYSPIVFSSAAQFSDGKRGMTCEYYRGSAKLEWGKPGGDWRDALNVTYGDTAFARATVTKGRAPQTVEWDVTRLVRRWESGGQPRGGIYLRQLAHPGSSVKFASRESEQAAARPRLRIEWDDGTIDELRPTADTTITCTSRKGQGQRKNLEVGNDRTAILVFPFVANSKARVRSARLILSSKKQYGKTSDIGIFQLSAPFGQQTKLRQGLAAGFRADEGITSHPAVVFAAGFESSDWQDEWSTRRPLLNAEHVIEDRSNRFAPLDGGALKVTIRKGRKTGMNLLYRFKEKLGSEPEEMYFRYYLRLGDNWKPTVGGKMPGFAGTYNRGGWGGRKSDGSNGWSARGRYSVSRVLGKDEHSLGSYVYHAGMTNRYGNGWGWGLGPTGVIKRNQWYSVEQYVKLNTPGKADGELKAWIDGAKVFDRKNLRFRDTRDLRIETLWMNVYHGGTEKAPQDISVYIDNVVIARDYIGPTSGISIAN